MMPLEMDKSKQMGGLVGVVQSENHNDTVEEASSCDEDQAQKERDIIEHSGDIFYSKRYNDDHFEFRHVILPKQLCKYYKADRLLSEAEWRGLGVQQSPGWIHYMIHKPEPHVLLFRRELQPEASQ